MRGRAVSPSTLETTVFEGRLGMWQSTQFSAMRGPSFGKRPQLGGVWQVRQAEEKEAASRWVRWTSWQVEQVMSDAWKQALRSSSVTVFPCTSISSPGSGGWMRR